MRVRIDKANCAGHARCAAVAGELFALDEEGYIASEGFEVPAGLEKAAQLGVRACPERVIAIED